MAAESCEFVVDSCGAFLASTVGRSGSILRLGSDSEEAVALETELDAVVSVDWHPSSDQVVVGSQASTVIHIYSVSYLGS